mgnify:CR=1 FL=1
MRNFGLVALIRVSILSSIIGGGVGGSLVAQNVNLQLNKGKKETELHQTWSHDPWYKRLSYWIPRKAGVLFHNYAKSNGDKEGVPTNYDLLHKKYHGDIGPGRF